MKKQIELFAILLLFLAFGCQKDTTLPTNANSSSNQEVQDGTLTFRNSDKVNVCHNGNIINVGINAVPGHQAHGDAVDMDGDGYFDKTSECGTGEADCDDNDPNVNVMVCDANIYDNENLSAGDLNGQDNWTTRAWGIPASSGNITAVANVQNGSLGLTSTSGGASVGTSGSRLENPNWQMPDNIVCAEGAYFEFEAMINHWGTLVGPGYDQDNDGIIGIFREAVIETPVYFWLSAASAPTWGIKLVTSAGATTVSVSTVGAEGDYVKIKVAINYQANGGAGSADCYYQNLTNGDTGYQPIAGLTGIPLDLDFNATDNRNPSLWNGFAYHFEGLGGQIDNFTFSNCQ